MPPDVWEAIRQARIQGRQIGMAALARQGFAFRAEHGDWEGDLELPDLGQRLPVTVQLPPTFPDSLPEVRVDVGMLAKPIAHVDGNGKICVAPTTGVLIDADYPAEIVEETLRRAATELSKGLRGLTDHDLATEFFAYWRTDHESILSICDPQGDPREIVLARVDCGRRQDGECLLLADRISDAAAWASNLKARILETTTVYFVALTTDFPPPLHPFTLAGMLKTIAGCVGVPQSTALLDYLSGQRRNVILVVALPEAERETGSRLIAFHIPRISDAARRRATKGFRKGRAPRDAILRAGAGLKLRVPAIVRLDAMALTARGGGSRMLASKTVTIVGVGAVGSEVALNLASSGVGRIRLIDHEHLEAGNVHRHVLGVKYLGEPKVTALATELGGRFPHLTFETRLKRIEDVLEHELRLVADADLVICTTGEETLERRLNRVLPGALPRIHAWVEPLGIAGHALCRRNNGPGCLECLFVREEHLGLVNRSALSRWGQFVRQSFGGCAGTFTPFAGMDARRTALEAATQAVDALMNRIKRNELITWRGDRTEFEDRRLQLSARAEMIRPGCKVTVGADTFARPDCPVCGERTS